MDLCFHACLVFTRVWVKKKLTWLYRYCQLFVYIDKFPYIWQKILENIMSGWGNHEWKCKAISLFALHSEHKRNLCIQKYKSICIGLGLPKNANQLFLTQTLVKTKQAWKGRSFFSENYFASILLCSTKFCQAFFWHLKKMILQRWTTLKTHLSQQLPLQFWVFLVV